MTGAVTQLSSAAVVVCPVLLPLLARAGPAAITLPAAMSASPDPQFCGFHRTQGNSPDVPSTTSRLSGIN